VSRCGTTFGEEHETMAHGTLRAHHLCLPDGRGQELWLPHVHSSHPAPSPSLIFLITRVNRYSCPQLVMYGTRAQAALCLLEAALPWGSK
jgi:hypothetical protein